MCLKGTTRSSRLLLPCSISGRKKRSFGKLRDARNTPTTIQSSKLLGTVIPVPRSRVLEGGLSWEVSSLALVSCGPTIARTTSSFVPSLFGRARFSERLECEGIDVLNVAVLLLEFIWCNPINTPLEFGCGVPADSCATVLIATRPGGTTAGAIPCTNRQYSQTSAVENNVS